ncbi:MAG: rod shape-determining protein MreC [Flammeovirgaceae bacterium]|nr:rod shape-determining protein MreC [Flammeovirgaceae bacterium]MBE63762.1 rod shape-determining protein MreC [Flammeovirgaceae bacterium]MBR07318.1 rod shape-determining protein MreC [Rickettsiales bacterium]HCX23194.1 rod shape-determining protein MreC [Cytophagales bacterium]|tara:strand:+ start:6356 stop:7168 length:813 start_codon:yes stop_codon:yes gene_type:complete
MQNLLNFLYRFRTFGLFLLLEGVCAWLIIAYNKRPNAAFLNSSNSLVASVNSMTSNTTNYFQLKQINDHLVAENQLLREQLANQSLGKVEIDSSKERYILRKAKVINNTFRRSMNYMTLDAGMNQGIQPGMGVISGAGVVGQVKSASGNFATVTSLLHRNLMISSSISRTKTLCTVQWDGISPLQADLKYVPRHIPIQVGDSITTSGFNSIFPDHIMIGTIASIELEDNDVFYDAKIDLSVDFSSINFVFVVENLLIEEQDSLELEAINN